MHRRAAFALTLALAASAALAHEGVQNPAVMERMELMKAVGEQTKALGDMVQGKVAFDETRAETAQAALAEAAARIPALFEARETDPKSEALPVIWDEWSDFVAKAEGMETAARDLRTGSAQTLRESFADLGQSCRACHEDYRPDD
jgi:cytochrome c556